MLTDIELPDTVTQIGASAFQGCSSLTDVVIPDTVTTIGEMAFSDCPKINRVKIPRTVSSIGNHAFGFITDENGDLSVNDDFTIGDYEGTEAHRYAEANPIKAELKHVPTEAVRERKTRYLHQSGQL